MIKHITFSSVFTVFLGIAFLFYGFRVSMHIAYILAFIALCGYITLYYKNLLKYSLSKDIKLLALAFIVYFCISLPPLFLNHGWQDSWRFQDSFSRFLIFASMLVLLFKFDIRIKEKVFYFCIFAGGIVNSLLGLYTRILGADRICLSNGIFQFGYFSSIIALIAFNLFLHHKSSRLIKIFSFITFTLCSIAVFLGISRGIILGYFMGLFFSFLIHLAHQNFFTLAKKTLLLCICTCIIFMSVPAFYQPLLNRTEQIQSETKSFDGTQQNTSIGYRFKIWDNGISMFKLSPIFGMNIKTRKELKEEITQNSTFKIPIEGDEHIGESHNETINALAKNGIIGLLGLYFLLFCVSKVFLSKLRNHHYLYPSCMLSILILYITDGCFNTPLDSKIEAPLFCICVIVFLKLFEQKSAIVDKMKKY